MIRHFYGNQRPKLRHGMHSENKKRAEVCGFRPPIVILGIS